ncbi:hypothetical protein KEM09_14855 [Carboxylicivirga mesophila]|uniref:Uncharacterized protein n=1 Tax=Carboxylicivirga mesophila TaxID=1166478 RepID=A0ABS5KCK6_9BACT|nr:hypothetical protein [Carboxylicivirga mesophila]MBS2212696.1 hypothetical protein [Carboxylicivirga mesophila]
MHRIVSIVFIVVCVISGFLLLASEQVVKHDYPVSVIQNDSIRVTVLMPDELNGYYRSTRFDWSGMIAQINYGDHEFLQAWEMYDGTVHGGVHDPLTPGTGTGTAEEFRNPLGYEEANVGEPFVKIGVGVLQRASQDPYFWDYPYKIIQSGKWDIQINKSSIVFKQSMVTDFGYAYDYEKQIRLIDNKAELEIIHMLKNCGAKPIFANPYCHNFFSFDNYPGGQNYKMVFPNDVCPVDQFDSRITFEGNEIKINEDDLRNDWIGGHINAGTSKEYTVINSKTRTSIKVIEDKDLGPFYIYMSRTSVCAEPMVEFSIDNGQSFTWKRTYQFNKNLRIK